MRQILLVIAFLAGCQSVETLNSHIIPINGDEDIVQGVGSAAPDAKGSDTKSSDAKGSDASGDAAPNDTEDTTNVSCANDPTPSADPLPSPQTVACSATTDQRLSWVSGFIFHDKLLGFDCQFDGIVGSNQNFCYPTHVPTVEYDYEDDQCTKPIFSADDHNPTIPRYGRDKTGNLYNTKNVPFDKIMYWQDPKWQCDNIHDCSCKGVNAKVSYMLGLGYTTTEKWKSDPTQACSIDWATKSTSPDYPDHVYTNGYLLLSDGLATNPLCEGVSNVNILASVWVGATVNGHPIR